MNALCMLCHYPAYTLMRAWPKGDQIKIIPVCMQCWEDGHPISEFDGYEGGGIAIPFAVNPKHIGVTSGLPAQTSESTLRIETRHKQNDCVKSIFTSEYRKELDPV